MDAKTAWNCLTDTCNKAAKNHIPKTDPTKQKQTQKSHPPLWMNEKVLKRVRKNMPHS